VIPSHFHWDHVSALEDFNGVPVWVQKKSYDEAISGQPPAFIRSQFDSADIRYNFVELDDQAFLGFRKSKDIFGDGSVVLVDTDGHVSGHWSLYVKAEDNKEYFFIGDVSWTLLGVTHNSPRPWFVNALMHVDSDPGKNNKMLEAIHTLAEQRPELIVVPAHDETVLERLPRIAKRD